MKHITAVLLLVASLPPITVKSGYQLVNIFDADSATNFTIPVDEPTDKDEKVRQSVLIFEADYCPACKTMYREVWSHPDVRKLLRDLGYTVNFIDVSHRPGKDAAKRAGVTSLPTTIIVRYSANTADGMTVVRKVGTVSRSEMIKTLREASRK